jgi:hypothetical protein
MRSSLKLLPFLALLAGGCMPVDPGFGEVHRANIERQVVDPDPQYAEEEIEGASGVRAAAAVTRYQQGQVKQPATVTTSTQAATPAAGSGPN